MPKVTNKHVCLTPHSVMNVRLAAQVLSTTVSKVLFNYGPADAAGTAEFCLMFDQFFDIMSVSSTTASSRELKPSNVPFSSFDDPDDKIFRRMVKVNGRKTRGIYKISEAENAYNTTNIRKSENHCAFGQKTCKVFFDYA